MLNENQSRKSRIGGIMVLYKPDWNLTSRAIEVLAPQVDLLCVVDNTPEADNSSHLSEYVNIHYIPLKENKGIAAAQNIGICYLIDNNYEFVLFSDQDSIIPEDTVEKLYNATINLQNKGYRIAAVGTRAINRQNGKPYPPKSLEFDHFTIRNSDDSEDDLTESYSVRSSVSLIPTISLLQVGGFDESLFIDGVDHEWCWRAWHSKQLRSFIVENATINHMLGEGDKSFAGKEIAISSSFRTYYQFRNFIWLYNRDATPSFWKKKNLKKFIIKAFYFPLFVSPRLKYARNIFRGIKDGLKAQQNGLWPSFQPKND